MLEGIKAIFFFTSQGRSLDFSTSIDTYFEARLVEVGLVGVLIKVLIELCFQLFFHVLIFKFDWLILM